MAAARVWAFYEDSLDDHWRDWLHEQWTVWAARAAGVELNLSPLRIEDLATVSARDYRSLTTIPLAHISRASEWYGPDPYDAPSE